MLKVAREDQKRRDEAERKEYKSKAGIDDLRKRVESGETM